MQKTYADIIVKRITICFILIGKQLEKYENLVGNDKIRALPEIRFVLERNHDGPIMIGDIELTDELLHEVELYLQEQIEMKHKPTVLH